VSVFPGRSEIPAGAPFESEAAFLARTGDAAFFFRKWPGDDGARELDEALTRR